MSSGNQSIRIDFRLLENPEFNKLMRSGCFNTYCQIRKMIWRSLKPSAIGDLHIRYMSGSLAAACKTKKLAQLCSVTPRQIRNDIQRMKEEYQIAECISENDYYIFILGEWNEIQRNGKPLRYEYYYLDKYATLIQHQSEDEEINFPSEEKDFFESRKFISPNEYINIREYRSSSIQQGQNVLTENMQVNILAHELSDLEMLYMDTLGLDKFSGDTTKMLTALLSRWGYGYVKKQMEYVKAKIEVFALEYHPSEGKKIKDYWGFVYCACRDNYAKAMIDCSSPIDSARGGERVG